MQLKLLNAVCGAQSSFIADADSRSAIACLLRDLLALTDSEYGLIGEVLHTPNGGPQLKVHAIANIAWDDAATRACCGENAPEPLIEQTLQANQAYGDQYRVQFKINERVEGIQVVVDSQRFIQVLSNFLSNAAKFSPPGGMVEVTARQGADKTVRIAVHDDGPGVPADFHNRIFQKFSQADASNTRQKEGTGLGLAITRELVERMGGTVGFVSEPDGGATFFFNLPICACSGH